MNPYAAIKTGLKNVTQTLILSTMVENLSLRNENWKLKRIIRDLNKNPAILRPEGYAVVLKEAEAKAQKLQAEIDGMIKEFETMEREHTSEVETYVKNIARVCKEHEEELNARAKVYNRDLQERDAQIRELISKQKEVIR